MVNALESQKVVILGGSSGLGYALAEHLLQATSATVIIASSSATRVNDAVSSLSKSFSVPNRISGLPINLSVKDGEEHIKSFFSKIGLFNHLVYTAADPLVFIPIQDITQESGNDFFGIRYWSVLACIKYALPYIPKDYTSSITLTTGSVAFRPFSNWGASVSGVAGAIDSLTRGLAVDLKPIRVNCIAPGVTDTNLWNPMGEEGRTEYMEKVASSTLTGRAGLAEEVAEGFAYAIRGLYTTGQTLHIDGGESLV